jgi:general secretion pathway protein G
MTRPLLRRLPARRPGEAGFTLLELLVVLAILVVIAGLVGSNVIGYLGKSKSQAAKVQAKNVATALELYRLDVGNYPSPEQGLDALVKAPAAVPAWNGPYLPQAANLLDPWGNPYRFKAPGDHGEVDVYSLGSDKAEGGTGEAKDVGNW